MSNSIRITVGDLEFEGELNDTGTAVRVYEALPIEGELNLWGEEIYFSTPVKADNKDEMRAEMGVGELAFWPSGQAFCIFWGATPASVGREPRAVSPVVPIGQLVGDIASLNDINDGQSIRIEPGE
ncbi:MAG: cyclophilin-like fold protein [Planctomycetota bacterium]